MSKISTSNIKILRSFRNMPYSSLKLYIIDLLKINVYVHFDSFRFMNRKKSTKNMIALHCCSQYLQFKIKYFEYLLNKYQSNILNCNHPETQLFRKHQVVDDVLKIFWQMHQPQLNLLNYHIVVKNSLIRCYNRNSNIIM